MPSCDSAARRPPSSLRSSIGQSCASFLFMIIHRGGTEAAGCVIMWEDRGQAHGFLLCGFKKRGRRVQDLIYTNTNITFISSFICFPADMGKERGGTAICHHHNNVRTAAAWCDVGMIMCEGCACVYLNARW